MANPGEDSSNTLRKDFIAAAEMAAEFIAGRRLSPVAQPSDAGQLREWLASRSLRKARPTAEVTAELFALLGEHAVRSDHPRYFGLFNPPATPGSIIGDLVAATVNPQLAVWSHAPAAAEIERYLVELFAQRIWNSADVAGHFTSGGTEANHTALLCALSRKYPDWHSNGLHGLARKPAIYASRESHLAWIKLARAAGLGSDAVRLVPTRDGLEMDAGTVADAIARDARLDPVLIVGTAGTTAHGAIDDLRGIAAVAHRNDAYFHVDAAWAGGGIIHPGVRSWLDGLDAADSVTLDPHKWLAVPMAAGMYLTRGWQDLQRAFAVSTSYMPSASLENHDAYIHSLQWSRRFIGLKLYASLATIGIEGYVDIMQKQIDLADRLRHMLRSHGWKTVNDTRLPLVCFVPDTPAGEQDRFVKAIESHVVESGAAWISSVKLRDRLVLRACITSHETEDRDIDALIISLNKARLDCERIFSAETMA